MHQAQPAAAALMALSAAPHAFRRLSCRTVARSHTPTQTAHRAASYQSQSAYTCIAPFGDTHSSSHSVQAPGSSAAETLVGSALARMARRVPERKHVA